LSRHSVPSSMREWPEKASLEQAASVPRRRQPGLPGGACRPAQTHGTSGQLVQRTSGTLRRVTEAASTGPVVQIETVVATPLGRRGRLALRMGNKQGRNRRTPKAPFRRVQSMIRCRRISASQPASRSLRWPYGYAKQRERPCASYAALEQGPGTRGDRTDDRDWHVSLGSVRQPCAHSPSAVGLGQSYCAASRRPRNLRRRPSTAPST